MLKNKNYILKAFSGLLVLSLSISSAYAAVLYSLSDTMSSVKINALSDHTFVFTTPTGISSGSSLIFTFPNSFSIPVGLTFADVDISTSTGQVTLAAVPIGATFGVVRTSANVLTITASSSNVITPGTTVTVKIGTNATFQSVGTYQITNDSTLGNQPIGISGTFGDNGTTTVNLLSDDNVNINAVVPQSFTFSISTNSINFGNLSSVGAKYASSTNTGGDTVDTIAHTLDISSNSSSGYTITVRGQTLTSQQNASNTITQTGPSPAVSSPGSEQFGIYATVSGGIGGVIATPYVTPSSFGYDATATSSSVFASGSSSSGSTSYSLHYLANISSLTEAGNYSSNLIYVGTANF